MRFGRSRSCSRPLSLPAVKPSLEEFRALAEKGNVVPVYAQLAADFETPLSAYLKIRDGQHAFLLESADYIRLGERIARLGLPVLFVLEGGYAVDEIGVNVVNTLGAFDAACG